MQGRLFEPTGHLGAAGDNARRIQCVKNNSVALLFSGKTNHANVVDLPFSGNVSGHRIRHSHIDGDIIGNARIRTRR